LSVFKGNNSCKTKKVRIKVRKVRNLQMVYYGNAKRRPLVSPSDKNDHHNKTKILLKIALKSHDE
jgi:hypothetical protein